MIQRLLLNLLLGAVAIALALFIYLETGKTPDSNTRPVSDLDTEKVSSIRITRLQAGPLLFNKRNGRWYIEREPELPADDFQVNTLLSLPRAVTDRHYPANTLDLETMGLLPPRATAVLDDEKFDLGDTDPIDNRRYVLNGTNVYLVTDRFQHLLNARDTNFVERKLLPMNAVLTGLSLPGLALNRGENGQWLLQPDQPDISANAIRALVSAWETASALYVRDYDGSDGEEIQVYLQGISGPVKFVLLAQEPEIVLARPDWNIQYHLSSGTGSNLLALTTTTEPNL